MHHDRSESGHDNSSFLPPINCHHGFHLVDLHDFSYAAAQASLSFSDITNARVELHLARILCYLST